MQYAIWNYETHSPTSVMQNLPDHLQGASIEELRSLGYIEMITQRPEDYIPRFGMLSGPARFRILDDGRILQYFPEADFSLNAVRKVLKDYAAKDAGRVLFDTDWYVIRKMETGKEIPEDVAILRQKVRDHLEWVENDVDSKDARSLVEYKWAYPQNAEQVLVESGAWVDIDGVVPYDDTQIEEDGIRLVDSRPNPVQIPRGFDSKVNPLMVAVEGTPISPPSDINDITPITPNERLFMRDPGPEVVDARVTYVDPDSIVEPELRIERMNEEERRQLDPDVRRRLEEEHLARIIKERGKVPVIQVDAEGNTSA